MEKGSKMANIAKKETLREKLHTANNVIKRLRREVEDKDSCITEIALLVIETFSERPTACDRKIIINVDDYNNLADFINKIK